MRVKDLMTKDVVTIGPEASLKDVATLLAEHGISGLPVVGARGEVLGIVSEGDIVQKEGGSAPRRRGNLVSWLFLGGFDEEQKSSAKTAGEAMTSPPVVVSEEAQAAEAARRMTELAVNRLPVLDREEKLVGIITRADLVKAFARPDEELLRDIRDEVIVKTLWIPAERVKVDVSKGHVTLSGRVETKAEAELVERFVAAVPGVVSLSSSLGWDYDERKPEKTNPRVPFAQRR
jgi:CBS domain-containing protein